jgi:hypothetical protein
VHLFDHYNHPVFNSKIFNKAETCSHVLTGLTEFVVVGRNTLCQFVRQILLSAVNSCGTYLTSLWMQQTTLGRRMRESKQETLVVFWWWRGGVRDLSDIGH